MKTATSQPLQSPLARQLEYEVRTEFDVPAVVSGVRRFCAALHAGELATAHVATAASELANNLWQHTSRGGHIRLQALQRAGEQGVELRAEDDGPGIPDPALAMSDGWSSSGGMGCGLPGVRRLMDAFELHTTPGVGTCVKAIKWWPSPRNPQPAA